MHHKEKARREFNKYEEFLEKDEFIEAKKKFEKILENEEVSKENRRHCYGRIFPMIAIYNTLKEKDGDSLARAEEVFNNKEVYPGIAKMKKFTKTFPFVYNFIVPFMKRFIKVLYRQSEDGFQIETLESDNETFQFNIHNCTNYNYCKKYEVPELCDIFCKSDDISCNAMKPHVSFERGDTLARDGKCCDFTYKLNK